MRWAGRLAAGALASLALLLQPARPASADPGMAGRVVTDLSMPSPRLGRSIPYNLYLPAGTGPWPVLYLLHGLGGNQGTGSGSGGSPPRWTRRSPPVGWHGWRSSCPWG